MDLVDLKSMGDVERLKLIENTLDAEVASIEQEARMLAETFWAHRDGLMEVRTGEGRFPALGCRVQSSEKSISISWFYYRFYRPKGSDKAKRTVVHIRKPKRGNAYTISALLKHASPEQESMVKMIEDEFSEMRNKLEIIRKMRHNLFYYRKACGIQNELMEKNEGDSK
jgi:hypothetical protein